MTEPTMTTNNESVSDAATSLQPKPHGIGKDITELVKRDIEARAVIGEKKYGERLRSLNGRDAMHDAYQEVLDLAMYMRQHIDERRYSFDMDRDYDAEMEKLQQETKTLREQVEQLTFQIDLAHKDKDVYLNAALEAVKSNSQLTLKLEQAQADNVRLHERVEGMKDLLSKLRYGLHHDPEKGPLDCPACVAIDAVLSTTPTTALGERYRRMKEALKQMVEVFDSDTARNLYTKDCTEGWTMMEIAACSDARQALATESDKEKQ